MSDNSMNSTDSNIAAIVNTTVSSLLNASVEAISNLTVVDSHSMSAHTSMGMTNEEELTHITHAIAHNFEVSSTLITVILLGKLLETFSKKQTVDKLS